MLSEDLDALCTQQLFRAAESLGFEENDDLNCILSQASETELSALCTDAHTYPILEPRLQPQLLSSTHQESATGSNRFAVPKTDADVQAVQTSAVPKNTSKSTSWAVNIWKEWTTDLTLYIASIQPYLLIN